MLFYRLFYQFIVIFSKFNVPILSVEFGLLYFCPMNSIRNTPLYQEAIHELNLDFGDFYLFETFIVGEVHKDMVVNWKDHFKYMVEQISHLYDQNGKDLVYITNRIHPYSVVPSDWLHFFKYSYSLKGYGIVSYTQKGRYNAIFEKLFMRSKMKNFTDINEAVLWAKEITKSKENAA